MKPDIKTMKLRKLVTSQEFTTKQKLDEIARRERNRVPEDYALASALIRAEWEVSHAK